MCSGLVEEESSAFPDVQIPAALTRRLGAELQPWQLEALRHPLGATYLLKRHEKEVRRSVVEALPRAVAAKEEARIAAMEEALIAAAAADGFEVVLPKRVICKVVIEEEVVLPQVVLACDFTRTHEQLAQLALLRYEQRGCARS